MEVRLDLVYEILTDVAPIGKVMPLAFVGNVEVGNDASVIHGDCRYNIKVNNILLREHLVITVGNHYHLSPQNIIKWDNSYCIQLLKYYLSLLQRIL